MCNSAEKFSQFKLGENSPSANKFDFLKLGKVTRTHGIKGEVFVSLFASSVDIPNFALFPISKKNQSGVQGSKFQNRWPVTKEGKQKKQEGSSFNAIIGQVVQIRKDTKLCLETQVLSLRFHKNGIIVHLKGVGDIKTAESLKEGWFFVPHQIFSSLEGESMYLCEILNFEVYDKKHGVLGKITAFSDNGMQDLLIVQRSRDFKEVQRGEGKGRMVSSGSTNFEEVRRGEGHKCEPDTLILKKIKVHKEGKQKTTQPVEIPFIKEFILDIDFELKQVRVDLYEGWPGLD